LSKLKKLSEFDRIMNSLHCKKKTQIEQILSNFELIALSKEKKIRSKLSEFDGDMNSALSKEKQERPHRRQKIQAHKRQKIHAHKRQSTSSQTTKCTTPQKTKCTGS